MHCPALPSVAGPEAGMGATSQVISIEELKPLKPEGHKAAPLVFWPEPPNQHAA